MAPEKNLTLEFTREEAALLWDMLAKKRQTTHSFDKAGELKIAKQIHDKINQAAKDAGYPMPGAPI